MRPIKLLMTAFGPYKHTEVIDFEELEDHQLFVISGQTGSGKTTIFDGICFALYGSASGQDRENNAMLRSDFADDDTHTAVELIFEQRGRRFRVLRQLGHVKKGNKTPTGDKYEFFEIVDDNEVPFVDRQMVSEINDRIEQLIGLTQDQFKQIVMLPQGEFRKLLTSETANKEQILRRLFKTETYQQISDRLRTKKDAVESEFKEVEQRQKNYIHHITATLPEREDSELLQLLKVEHFNVNQVLTGLDEEIKFYKMQVKQDETKYEQAYKQHHEHQNAYHKAKTINERFIELEQKTGELKVLADQASLYETKGKQLKDAERASRITVYEKQVESWQQDHKQKKTAKIDAERSEENAKKKVQQIGEAYEKEKQNESKREEIRKQLDQLKQHLPTVKDIDERKRNLNGQKTKLQQQHEQIKTLQNKITAEKENNEKVNKDITKLEQALTEETAKKEQLTKMREKAVTIQQFEKLREKQEKLGKVFQRDQQAFEKLQQKYRSLEKEWLANQASMLAAHLHDGDACPVCGSHIHPEKASEAAGAVTREQLDLVKKELDKQDEVYRTAYVNMQANVTQIEEQEEKVRAYNISVDETQDVLAALTKDGLKLKDEVDQLKKSRETVKSLKNQHNEASKKITELEQTKEKQDSVFQKEKTVYEREKAVFDDRLQKIPEEVRILTVLEEKIRQTEAVQQAMRQAWEAIQKQLQTAEQQHTKAEANVLNAHKQLKETATKLAEANEQFNHALKEAQFLSVEQYINAKMPDESQEQLKKDIELYKQNRTTLTKQVSELKELLANKEKVNISALEEQLKQLKEAYEKAFKDRNNTAKLLDESSQLNKNIKETTKLVIEKEKEFAMITDLFDVTRGHNARRISFERYLQIDYLEQIIEAANSRLRHLSNGQFLLKRSDRQEAYGRQSGLALDVHDAYTGQTRDVKTLSGGEKFNASLCLALGMSDVIQSFQGNVAIDTMFIDEGFGSLDEESLHKAIDTLIDLQETGRMIGVISHVQELKTIFPAVLQVQKNREGYSEANFVIK